MLALEEAVEHLTYAETGESLDAAGRAWYGYWSMRALQRAHRYLQASAVGRSPLHSCAQRFSRETLTGAIEVLKRRALKFPPARTRCGRWGSEPLYLVTP